MKLLSSDFTVLLSQYRVFLLFSLLAAQGCFRMGLPEVVGANSVTGRASALFPVPQSSYSERLGRSGSFILLGSHSYADPNLGFSLGHQFLLGFIPFTRVFLEHGSERFLDEVFIQVLLDQGHRVLEVPAAQLDSTAVDVPLAAALTPLVSALRVNAYDAIFFRIADVSGKVQVRYHSPATLEPLRSEELTLDETEYRKQAQAPVLSAILQRSFRNAAETLLQKVPSHRIARAMAENGVPQAGDAPALWLVSPVFERPPAPAIGEYLSASYGFASVPALPPPAMLRLVQRGMSGELFRNGSPFIALLDSGQDLRPPHALRTFVKRLEIEDSKQLVLELRFQEERAGVLIREETCALRLAELGGVDGAGIVTLEHAAAAGLRAFWSQGEKQEAGSVPVACAKE